MFACSIPGASLYKRRRTNGQETDL